jgi:hypothetical protein
MLKIWTSNLSDTNHTHRCCTACHTVQRSEIKIFVSSFKLWQIKHLSVCEVCKVVLSECGMNIDQIQFEVLLISGVGA